MSDQPTQFMLFPTPSLVGESNIDRTVTSADGGITPGRVVPDSTNNGAASAFMTGTYGSIGGTDFTFRCFDSGANYAGGTWGWQQTGKPRKATQKTLNNIESKAGGHGTFNITYFEVEDGFKGFNDYRYMHSRSNAIPSNKKGKSCTAGYLKNLNREMYFYTCDDERGVVARYRTASDTNFDTWTSEVVQFHFDQTEAGASPPSPSAERSLSPWLKYKWGSSYDPTVNVCALDDDSLLMIVPNGDDFWIFRSTDGLNWYVHAKNILSRFAVRTRRIRRYTSQVKIAKSGNYLRIVFVDFKTENTGSDAFSGEALWEYGVDIGYTFRFLVSSDRGATWSETNYQEEKLEIRDWFDGSVDQSEFCGMDLGGCDDLGGTFIFAYTRAWTGGPRIKVMTATKNGEFLQNSNLYIDGQNHMTKPDYKSRSIWFVRGPQFLHMFYSYQTSLSYMPSPASPGAYGDGDEATWTIEQTLIDPYNAVSYTGWKTLAGSNTGCTMGLNPAFPCGVSNGSWVSCGGGRRYIQDHPASFAGDFCVGGFYFRVGGWDSFPMSDRLSPQYSAHRAHNGSWQPSENRVEGYWHVEEQKTKMDRPIRIDWSANFGDPSDSDRTFHNTFWAEFGSFGPTGSMGTYYTRNSKRGELTTNTTGSWGRWTMTVNYATADGTAVSTEDRSWGCGPVKDTSFASPAGSVVEWSCQIRNSSVTNDAVHIELRSRPWVGDEEDDVFNTIHLKVHFQAPWDDADENSRGASRQYQGVVAVEDVNKAGPDVEDRIVCGIPIDKFNDTYWEFRLVIAPYLNSSQAKTRFTKCRLMGRPYGSTKWYISDVPITDNDGPTAGTWNEKGLQYAFGTIGADDQFISFGHGVSTGVADMGSPTQSRWKYLRLWSPCTMQQMQDIDPFDGNEPDFSRYEDAPWIYPNCLRGQLFSSDPTYVSDGVSLHWGAVGAIERDGWTSTPTFQYSAANLFQPSPRIKWRSPDNVAATTVSYRDIVLKADGDNANASFDADAIAVIGSNAQSIQVAFASDTNFSSDYITETFSMHKFGDANNRLRINTAENNVIYIDEGQYAPYPGQLIDGGGSSRMNLNRGKRAWIEMYNGTGGELRNVYEITRHVGATSFHVDAPGSTFSGIAGASIRLIMDRGVFFLHPSNVKTSAKHKFMKIRPKGKTATGYYEIGSVVVGSTFTLDGMPMEWTYTDNQQPNITTYRTKGAVEWGFVEGPPQRRMESLFVGDVSQNREKMRGLINQTASYSRIPVVFGFTITPSDDSTPSRILGHDNVMLSWVKSGGDLKQGAWYKDSNGIWRNAGDMAISLVECV